MSAGLVLWDSNVLGREREKDGLSQQVTADAGGKLTTILCRQLLPMRKPGLAYKDLRQPLVCLVCYSRYNSTLLQVYIDIFKVTLPNHIITLLEKKMISNKRLMRLETEKRLKNASGTVFVLTSRGLTNSELES